MTRIEWGVGAIFAVACLAFGGSAAAGTSAAGFRVNANVSPKCMIVVRDLAFGNYDPLVVNAQVGLDAAATLTVTCTRGLFGAILVDSGLNGDPSGSVRQMSAGSQRLAYQIFKDSAHTTVWRAGYEGAAVIQPAGAGSPERITLFGRIPPGQVVLSGRYADTITASMQF